MGKPRPAAVRAKISAAQRGRVFSPETRAKMSAAGKVKVMTPEHRAKLSAAGIGRRHSPDDLAKMSAAQRGKPHPWQAERVRQMWAAMTPAERAARSAPGLIALARPEARARQGQAMKSSPRALIALDKARTASTAKPSSIELTVRSLLTSLGVAFTPAFRIGRYVADIYVPSRRLVIECDGEYWHRNRQTQDAARDAYMKSLGYSVLRLPENDIRAGIATPRVLAAIGWVS